MVYIHNHSAPSLFNCECKPVYLSDMTTLKNNAPFLSDTTDKFFCCLVPQVYFVMINCKSIRQEQKLNTDKTKSKDKAKT